MAYKLTLSNKNMHLGSQNVVLYGMQNLRNILDDVVVVKGYAQMNRIVENTFEDDGSFGYESIMHRELHVNKLPLTDECHSIELSITNTNAAGLFTFKGEKVPANIESCKIINKKLKSAYDNMPCPDSVEVAIEAEWSFGAWDFIECDSLEEAAELAEDEDETISIAYGFLEDTWRYKVIEIDKSYENQVAELKTWLKEYWQSCIENSDYPAITKVLEEIKSIRSLSEFDEIEASEYSEPIIILRKSIDKDYMFELEVKIGNARDGQDHEFFKGNWHHGENFKYVKDLQANFKAIKYDLSDLDHLENIQKVFTKLRDNVDDDIDACLNRIYNQEGLTPIGFEFQPNAHAEDWDEDDYYTRLIFEDIHESIYYY